TKEHTYHFLDEFIGEMAKLFPDQCFHIGGDEVNGKQWDANPQIQAFMRAHGMKTNQDLQAYFNKRVQEIVSKHGKTMIGWDEILRPELPKSIVIQSWRGQESLAQAAKHGYRSLLSHGYYIDLMCPASQHHLVDPMSDAAARIDIAPLQVLAEVAEPVKDYTREDTAAVVPTSLTPLNRVVDAARPESDTARQFSDMVNALLSGKAKPGTEAQIRTLLSRWR